MPPGDGGHLDDVLSAYLDDELAPAARHEAEAHLAACAACRTELDDVAAARRAIRVLPVHSAPRPLIGAGTGPPESRAWAPRSGPAGDPAGRRRRLAWAAVAAAAAVVAVLLPRDPDVEPKLPSLADSHAATASVTGDPLSQLAPIAVPVRFGP
ncbi:MAG TPA: zf-HC2 domain-containing protein [Acidimicrobiia bacterium]|nr:zf-HC2 domain-containing protein [Acidimicrobiia bacterium]